MTHPRNSTATRTDTTIAPTPLFVTPPVSLPPDDDDDVVAVCDDVEAAAVGGDDVVT